MKRLRSKYPRFSLTPSQTKAIYNAANCFTPAKRHSFLLRVERTLAISGTSNFGLSDELVRRALDHALREVE